MTQLGGSQPHPTGVGFAARGTGRPATGKLRRVAAFVRQHRIFGAVVLVAAAVRFVAMLGYPGPLLYPDTSGYVTTALHLAPAQLRPFGYSAMLWMLGPLHSLAAVIVIQHLMGLAIGMLGYALLRRRGLPGWGAALAMAPVLLSAYAIQLEHFLLSDTLFALLVMMALVAMMWWQDPPLWACALAGLLLAAAAIVRTQGTPLLIGFAVCMLIRFAGWRTLASVAVLCVACACPLAGYAGWFDYDHGSFNLTTGDGAFLYAEVTTFSDCVIIRPPADERFLCLKVPVSERPKDATYYLFRRNPLRNEDGGIDGNSANAVGTDFAIRAIRAQPLDYLRAVGENFAESFALHGGNDRPHSITWEGAQSELGYMFPVARQVWPLSYDDRFFRQYDGAVPDERVLHPYSGWIGTYQRYIVVSGPLLGVITLIGLAGLVASWRRRGGPALLPWLTGIALLIVPAAVLWDLRFIVCAVPPLCVAAALGVQQLAGHRGLPG